MFFTPRRLPTEQIHSRNSCPIYVLLIQTCKAKNPGICLEYSLIFSESNSVIFFPHLPMNRNVAISDFVQGSAADPPLRIARRSFSHSWPKSLMLALPKKSPETPPNAARSSARFMYLKYVQLCVSVELESECLCSSVVSSLHSREGP